MYRTNKNTTATPLPKIAVTTEEAAQIYGPEKGTLANWRSQRKGPHFYRVGRKILYKIADLEAFLFQKPVQTIDSHNDR
jgi:hypothetical protein